MDRDQVRRICLAQRGATEVLQWGDALVFKAGGKMFALLHLEPAPTVLCFKCTDEEFADLNEQPGCVPAPYLARAKWIALETFDALPAREIERLLRRSYALVVAKLPRKTRETL